jgi:hypothetical protein
VRDAEFVGQPCSKRRKNLLARFFATLYFFSLPFVSFYFRLFPFYFPLLPIYFHESSLFKGLRGEPQICRGG